MTPALDSRVVINRDIPQENLKQGDLATYIDVVARDEDGEDGAVLELYDALGEPIRVVAVPMSAIEPLRMADVPPVVP
ncbi:MAG: DUF4926 domain-containing protein [Anaerolineae bacterium]|nr:DUF4926 domain-containing protein [Anaerolineae bacterium]